MQTLKQPLCGNVSSGYRAAVEFVRKDRVLYSSTTIPCTPKAVLPPNTKPGQVMILSFLFRRYLTRAAERSTDSCRRKKLQKGQSTESSSTPSSHPGSAHCGNVYGSCPAMADCIQTPRKSPSGLSSALLRTSQSLCSDQSEQTPGLAKVTIFGSGFV